MIDPVIQQLKGKLIVSCQAYMGEPLRHPETMAQMARACELGGAGGIRCQGLSDISAIKGRTEVPVIGIWKEGHEGVYITPTLRHARACVAAGADIVAVDATDRPRPDGKTLEDTVRPLKEEGVLVMADCSTIEDIRHAFAIGSAKAASTRPPTQRPPWTPAPGQSSREPPSRTPHPSRAGLRKRSKGKSTPSRVNPGTKVEVSHSIVRDQKEIPGRASA